MPEIYKNRLTVAPRRVTGNTPKAASSWKPEQRVVLHFLFVQILRVMSSNLKKTLDNQKKINEAVEKIIKHFSSEESYAETLQTLADAQSQIIMMMKYVQSAIIQGEDGVNLDIISDFLYDVNVKIKLLKPFADMIGQVYGNED